MLTGTRLFTLWVGLFAGVSVIGPGVAQERGIEGTPSTRTPWTTSRVKGSPDPPLPYRIERVFPSLSFDHPVEMIAAPEGDRFYVAELNGTIRSFPAVGDPKQTELFFDLKESNPKAQRLYGVAFHPDFAKNGFVYVCYVLAANVADGTRVSRFQVNEDGSRIDPASETLLLTWLSGGHNGGSLKFGPDGYLYISAGDGGPAFPADPLKAGQDVSNVLSTIMRVDVNRAEGGKNYAIPSDNPLRDIDGARGEVWAYGFRNPWRMSFDPPTGDLWVGDVGWELWEMVYRVQRGANYGWSLVEGRQPVHTERPRGPSPIVPPTIEHSHIESRSITGGFVYRGSRLRDLAGAYIYGDYVTGKIWGARLEGDEVIWREELVDTPLQIICFAVDRRNELYVVDYVNGGVHRLVRNESSTENDRFPQRLSETGLFTSASEHKVAPGVLSYFIRAEPWSDGATARRWIALPGATRLETHKRMDRQQGWIRGQWKYPKDAVLMKTLSLEMKAGDPDSARRLETQLLHFDGADWRAYTYIWNDEQTDASLAPREGVEKTFVVEDEFAEKGRRAQTWRVFGRSECMLCHTPQGGFVYGFRPEQLAGKSQSGHSQLDQFHEMGLFSQKPKPGNVFADPYNHSESLAARARAYLHINCSQCHQRGGGGTAALDLPHQIKLEKTHMVAERPTQGAFGLHGASVVAPGDPYRSVLYYRMAKLGRGRMPYFGSRRVDPRGVQLIHDWIDSLDSAEKRSAAVHRDAQKKLTRRVIDATLGPEKQRAACDELLSTTSGALLLVSEISKRQVNRNVRDAIVDMAMSHSDRQIRDLFERFLPEEKQSKRLGASVDVAKILALPGRPNAGATLFREGAGVQCRNCHRIGERGKHIGPDLSAIGKTKGRDELLQSILEPSRKIEPKYVTYLVETTDGKVLTGVLKSRDEKEVVLLDAQAREVRVLADNIGLITPSQRSLMPDLLVSDLTAEQLADLFAYLASLK